MKQFCSFVIIVIAVFSMSACSYNCSRTHSDECNAVTALEKAEDIAKGKLGYHRNNKYHINFFETSEFYNVIYMSNDSSGRNEAGGGLMIMIKKSDCGIFEVKDLK